MNTELVAFRVEHHYAVFPSAFVELVILGGSKAYEPFDLPVHLFLSQVEWYSQSPAGIDVDMEPIFPQLGSLICWK